MRAVQALSEVVRWRWMPAVGLTLGALTYALLVSAVMPLKFGDGTRALVAVADDDSPRSPTLTQSLRPVPTRAVPSRAPERALPAFGNRPMPTPVAAPPPPPPPPEPEPQPEAVAPPPPPPPPPVPDQVPEHDQIEEDGDGEEESDTPPQGAVTPRTLAAPLRMLRMQRDQPTPGAN